MRFIVNKAKNKMASVVIAFDAGCRAEDINYEMGTAHAVEHMLFKGTNTRDAKEISGTIEFLGGRMNAYTSKNTVCYTLFIPSENLSLGLDILADMINNSTFEVEKFNKEMEVILEEEIMDKCPEQMVMEKISSIILPGRLKIPIIGTQESISNITRDGAFDFYKNFYSNKHGIAAITSCLPKKEVASMLRKHFGNNRKFALRTKKYEVDPIAKDYIEIKKEGMDYTHACICADGLNVYDKKIHALDLAMDILGGGASSRLFKEVRENRGLVYGISARAIYDRDCGFNFVSFSTRNKNLDEVLNIVQEEINLMAKNGISDYELESSKNQERASVYSVFDSPASLLNVRMQAEYYGTSSIEEDIEILNGLTKDDVMFCVENIIKGLNDSQLIVTCRGE